MNGMTDAQKGVIGGIGNNEEGKKENSAVNKRCHR
jgi:hypothetical protein